MGIYNSNNELIRLMVDTYRNTGDVATYSNQHKASEDIRKALFELLGGEDAKIDPRSLRYNPNTAKVFDYIELIIPLATKEGFAGDEFFTQLVEYHNVEDGDTPDFVVKANNIVSFSEMADGIARPRRQRIGEKQRITPTMSIDGAAVYEELSRLLSKKVEWNEFLDAVAEAQKQKEYAKIYGAVAGITASTPGMDSTLAPAAGSYSENVLMSICDEVETYNQSTPVIFGTKAALRKITGADLSEKAKTDKYEVGYYGKINGYAMVAVKNRKKAGTNTNLLPNNKVYIIGSDDKPIKYVTEGKGYIDEVTNNADQTREYRYLEKTGCMLVLSGKMGVYTITG